MQTEREELNKILDELCDDYLHMVLVFAQSLRNEQYSPCRLIDMGLCIHYPFSSYGSGGGGCPPLPHTIHRLADKIISTSVLRRVYRILQRAYIAE